MLDIIPKLRELGYQTISSEFYTHVNQYKEWYQGKVRDFSKYKVYNGQSFVTCDRYSLGMAKKIAEDWANLLMNEKVTITLDGKKEQQFVDDVLRRNNFRVRANEMQELKFALGTVAYIPSVKNLTLNTANGEILTSKNAFIKIEYVTMENIFPISWENGVVKECAFTSIHTTNGADDKYCYLQLHLLQDDEYVIQNKLYKIQNNYLYPVSLKDAAEFDNIPETIYLHSPMPTFVIDRPNIANNLDYTLPVGIPPIANCIDSLKGADIAYDGYINEFVLGKKRIMIKPAATQNLDGSPVFDPNDVTYYALPEDTTEGDIIHEIDMTIRASEFNQGVQDFLNIISSKCGFGENHYRFNQGNIATATQVISENSEMFRTLKKHEIILDSVLKQLCRIILHLGNSVLNMDLKEDAEISIDFDDSIIEDKESEFNRDMRLLQAGIMNDYEFRAKWMNEDEETAKSKLPEMTQLLGSDISVNT